MLTSARAHRAALDDHLRQVIAQKHQGIAAMFQELRSHQLAMDARLQLLGARLAKAPAPGGARRAASRRSLLSGGERAAAGGGEAEGGGL